MFQTLIHFGPKTLKTNGFSHPNLIVLIYFFDASYVFKGGV